jgi:hypothetical protein
MTTTPGTYNIQIYQGQTLSLAFIWSTGSCCGCGTVGSSENLVDLTGYTATMQIRQFASQSAPLLYDASSSLVLGGTAGSIVLTIADTVTNGFTWFSGVYDLFLYAPDGVATALLAGQVSVTSSVST